MRLYKLTNENGLTRNNTQWGEGVTHTAPGVGKLCTSGWIHAYESPLLAVLMNPVHANFTNPLLWEAEGEIGISNGAKCGVATLTTLRQMEPPIVSTAQRVAFGILATLAVHKEPNFVAWAQSWLDGSNRSQSAATYAADAADATYATYAAAYAAAGYAVYAAAAAATYATYAAYAAADAAAAAASAQIGIDLVALAEESLKYK